MFAPLASNRLLRPVRRAFFGPTDVRSLTGYTSADGRRRTRVVFTTGQTAHLEMPIEEVRAALDAERAEMMLRTVRKIQREREEFEAAHPEWAEEFAALRQWDTVFEAAYQQVVAEAEQ
ncbi:hypothetical protein GCM10028801_36170 [Nocardioides maradonensis]